MKNLKQFLAENSLYSNDQEKVQFLSKESTVMDAFIVNFFFTLVAYNMAENKAKFKAHFSKDLQVRIQNIKDENNDISLVVKLVNDIGAFRTATTVNEITRFLAKLKTKSIDSVDMPILFKWLDDIQPQFYMKISKTFRNAVDDIRNGNYMDGVKTVKSRVRKYKKEVAGEFAVLLKGAKLKEPDTVQIIPGSNQNGLASNTIPQTVSTVPTKIVDPTPVIPEYHIKDLIQLYLKNGNVADQFKIEGSTKDISNHIISDILNQYMTVETKGDLLYKVLMACYKANVDTYPILISRINYIIKETKELQRNSSVSLFKYVLTKYKALSLLQEDLFEKISPDVNIGFSLFLLKLGTSLGLSNNKIDTIAEKCFPQGANGDDIVLTLNTHFENEDDLEYIPLPKLYKVIPKLDSNFSFNSSKEVLTYNQTKTNDPLATSLSQLKTKYPDSNIEVNVAEIAEILDAANIFYLLLDGMDGGNPIYNGKLLNGAEVSKIISNNNSIIGLEDILKNAYELYKTKSGKNSVPGKHQLILSSIVDFYMFSPNNKILANFFTNYDLVFKELCLLWAKLPLIVERSLRSYYGTRVYTESSYIESYPGIIVGIRKGHPDYFNLINGLYEKQANSNTLFLNSFDPAEFESFKLTPKAVSNMIDKAVHYLSVSGQKYSLKTFIKKCNYFYSQLYPNLPVYSSVVESFLRSISSTRPSMNEGTMDLKEIILTFSTITNWNNGITITSMPMVEQNLDKFLRKITKTAVSMIESDNVGFVYRTLCYSTIACLELTLGDRSKTESVIKEIIKNIEHYESLNIIPCYVNSKKLNNSNLLDITNKTSKYLDLASDILKSIFESYSNEKTLDYCMDKINSLMGQLNSNMITDYTKFNAFEATSLELISYVYNGKGSSEYHKTKVSEFYDKCSEILLNVLLLPSTATKRTDVDKGRRVFITHKSMDKLKSLTSILPKDKKAKLIVDTLNNIQSSKSILSSSEKQDYIDQISDDIMDPSEFIYDKEMEPYYEELSTRIKAKLSRRLITIKNIDLFKKQLYVGDIVPFHDLSLERTRTVAKFNEINIFGDDIPAKELKSPESVRRIIDSIQHSGINDIDYEKIEYTQDELDKLTVQYHLKNRSNKHGRFGLKFVNVYNVKIPIQEESQKRWLEQHIGEDELTPMFHGTGSIAAAFILRNGFRVISSSDKSVAGRMLGDGIYAAIHIDKSAQYMGDPEDGSIFGRSIGRRGFLFEMQGALGKYKKDYTTAGMGNDSIRSPEWCVFTDPNGQFRIYKAFECVYIHEKEIAELVSKHGAGLTESFAEYYSQLNEQKNAKVKSQMRIIFHNGNVLGKNQESIPFEKFKGVEGIFIEPTQYGPSLVINNTNMEGTFLVKSPMDLMINHPKVYNKLHKYLDKKLR